MTQELKWKVQEVPSGEEAEKIFKDEDLTGLMIHGCYGNSDMVVREITDQLHHAGVSEENPNEMFTKVLKVHHNEKRYDLYIGFKPGSKVDLEDLKDFAEHNEMKVLGLNESLVERKNYTREGFSKYPYQMYFSDNGMADAVGADSVEELTGVAKKRGLKSFAIFKNGSGFHSTEQDEFLVKWYDETGHGYWSNRARKEPELNKKKMESINEMNTFDVKKRKILSFDDFCKNGTLEDKNLKVLKGRTGIVKDAMSGEHQGPKGYDTLEDPKRINIKEAESMGNLAVIHKDAGEARRKKFQEENKDLKIGVGDWVKMAFVDGKETEHMWVKIKKVKDKDNFEGVLDNDPIVVHNIKLGDKVTVKRSDIEQHLPKE